MTFIPTNSISARSFDNIEDDENRVEEAIGNIRKYSADCCRWWCILEASNRCDDPYVIVTLRRLLIFVVEFIIVDIRIQQRNGRKTITTIEGLPKEFDLKTIMKAFKKEFACNGTISTDPVYGEIIQLNGDHRDKIASFLVDEEIAKREHIKIHGF